MRPALFFYRYLPGWRIFWTPASLDMQPRILFASGYCQQEPLLLNIAVVWRKDVFITREARQFIRFMKSRIE